MVITKSLNYNEGVIYLEQFEVIDGKIVIRKKEHIKLPEAVDAEFMDVLNDVIKEHNEAFKGLVDR